MYCLLFRDGGGGECSESLLRTMVSGDDLDVADLDVEAVSAGGGGVNNRRFFVGGSECDATNDNFASAKTFLKGDDEDWIVPWATGCKTSSEGPKWVSVTGVFRRECHFVSTLSELVPCFAGVVFACLTAGGVFPCMPADSAVSSCSLDGPGTGANASAGNLSRAERTGVLRIRGRASGGECTAGCGSVAGRSFVGANTAEAEAGGRGSPFSANANALYSPPKIFRRLLSSPNFFMNSAPTMVLALHFAGSIILTGFEI